MTKDIAGIAERLREHARHKREAASDVIADNFLRQFRLRETKLPIVSQEGSIAPAALSEGSKP